MGCHSNCDDVWQQANFVSSMNELYNPSKSDSTDYLTKGINFNPDLREWFLSLDFNEIDNSINYAFSGMVQYGEGLIASGDPFVFVN